MKAPAPRWRARLGVLIGLAGCIAPAVARAHAFLLHATPAVGSTVRTAPDEVAIAFSSGVEPAFSRIAVTNAAGVTVDDGQVRAEGASRLAVGLKPLPAGRYVVRWHAVSTDTHRTEGSFSFTVAP